MYSKDPKRLVITINIFLGFRAYAADFVKPIYFGILLVALVITINWIYKDTCCHVLRYSTNSVQLHAWYVSSSTFLVNVTYLAKLPPQNGPIKHSILLFCTSSLPFSFSFTKLLLFSFSLFHTIRFSFHSNCDNRSSNKVEAQ